MKKSLFIFAVAFLAFLVSCAPEANDVNPFTFTPHGGGNSSTGYGNSSSSSYGNERPSSSSIGSSSSNIDTANSSSSDDSSSSNNNDSEDINTGKSNVIPIYPCSVNDAENGIMTRECYDLTFGRYKESLALVYYEIDSDGLILLRRINEPEMGNEIVTGAGFCDWNGITVEETSQILLDGTVTAGLIEWYSLNDLENLYSLRYRDCSSVY